MKNKGVAIALLVLILAFAGFYVFSLYNTKPVKKPATSTPATQEQNDPHKFTHEASLTFLRNGAKLDTVASFDIEIVDDEYGITKGLMYRKQMDANRGMLFIFPDSRMRSFWMKNTIIPLDIIFINSSRQVVNIQENTVPFSERSIPSTGDAMFVLEINAGKSAELGLKQGDQVAWNLLK